MNIVCQEIDIVSFTSSLLRNQHLADLVHEIEIEQRFDIATDETLERYILAHPVTTTPVERSDGTPLETESPEWWAARVLEVLFFRLRKLSSITLFAHNDDFADEVLTSIIDKHQHDLAFLQNFSGILVRGSYNEASENTFTKIIPLISSTRIQRLQIWDRLCTAIPESCRLPSLFESRIMNSALDIGDFFIIVEWCPNL